MAKPMTQDRFRRLFADDDEFAVIDPRDAAEFGTGHLLAATNLPVAQIEERVRPLIPLTDTLCVLCDAGDGSAEAAAERLEAAGYHNLEILQGGIDAWRDSGGANLATSPAGEESACWGPDSRSRTSSRA